MRFTLTPEMVIKAYTMGIFPMGDDDGTIRWYSPDPRCVFDLNGFHVSRRLLRTYRSGEFELRVNSDWDGVLRNCANRDTTWINDQIFSVYGQLHRMGLAHTVEAYKDGQLAGGLYGVTLGGAFMGESMFHTVTDASKICLVHLVERMRARGFVLLDCQFMTAHLATLGAVNISRDQYLIRLTEALSLDCRFA